MFYPPLSWLGGALLSFILPWKWLPTAYIWLCLTGTGFTTRRLASVFLPSATATYSGIIATAAPYALFTAYERSAFSELAAAALIPLLLLYALRPVHQGVVQKGPLFPYALTLVLAAIWLTNAPAGVMASYLLVFVTIVTAWTQRSWKPVLRNALSIPIALGIAAFYLVPAAWEQRWIAINQAIDIGMRVQDSWLFAHHASPDLELHDQVLGVASAIMVVTLSIATLGFLVAMRNRKISRESRSIWLPLALLIPLLFLMQFPISADLWRLPKLEFLQFPWRWLAVLDTPFAIFVAAAIPLATRRLRIASGVCGTALLLLATTTYSLVFLQLCDEEDDVGNHVSAFHSGVGDEGTDEYAPTGADNGLVASNLPQACLVGDPLQVLGESDSGDAPVWYPEQGSCDDVFTATHWQSEHKVIVVDSDQNGFLVLRNRRYPAWRMTMNGQVTQLAAMRPDGLIVIPIAAGPSTVEIQWQTTPDALWGLWISLGAVFLLVVFWIVECRPVLRLRTAIHLSS